MKEVSVVSARPVQALDPVNEGPLDELQDKLVPVQEDELPQGVLDLVASLIRHHHCSVETDGAVIRSSMGIVWKVNAELEEVRPIIQARVGVEDAGTRPWVRSAMPVLPAGLPFSTPIPHPLPQRLEPVAPTNDKAAPTYPAPMESTPLDPVTDADALATSRPDEPLPHVPLSHQGIRQTPSIAPAPIPSAPMPPPLPGHEIEISSGTERGLLQVPFNRGAVSGQVTISRLPDDPVRHLTLSPSNAQVLEQLKMPFELVREPAWRLADRGDEQPRQGSHQAPDEDQDEPSGLPA